ncbi:MAG TPA: hypothetical protein VNS81_10660 [Nocardioides sp.]|nr:hypothetical protein [Nocardioides sp.]
MSQVLVQLEASVVPGLLLKWGREHLKALVTYELDGRVSTEWITADCLLPMPD